LDQQLLIVHGSVTLYLFLIRKLNFRGKNLTLNLETYILFFNSIAQYICHTKDF
jgi:hypothetical protein